VNAIGAAHDQFEQPVIRTDIPAVRGLDDDRPARAANPRVDNCEHDRPRRKPHAIGGQQVSGRLGLARGQIGKEIDHRHCWRGLVQHRLDLTGVRPLEAEIREQDDHFSKIVGWVRWNLSREIK